MKHEIRQISNEDLRIIQDKAKRVIRECYNIFLSKEAIDWFINSGESDNEFVKHFDNCKVLVLNNRIMGFTIFFDIFFI